MKILITGSSGYVGYVLSRFFSEKKINVIGLDVSENHAWEGNKNFKFYFCDIRDKKKIKEIFAKEQPTHVIHLAYLMSSIRDEKKEYDIDVNGSKYAFEAANSTKSVCQFIEFSSTSGYGSWPDNKKWLTEDDPLNPGDFRYGANKKIIETYLNKTKNRKTLKLVIVRMCTAIGPLYHKEGGMVKLLVNAPLLIKPDNRICEVQFIHEDDLTALINLIVNDKTVEGTYNLVPNDYSTTKEMSPEKFFLYIPLSLIRLIVGMLYNLGLYNRTSSAMNFSAYGIVADPKKIMKKYNYKFKYTTLSGFKDTVAKRKKLGTL
ncbi:MAG: NAD-dependent epimerase/dehydratase family protein [archaeon]